MLLLSLQLACDGPDSATDAVERDRVGADSAGPEESAEPRVAFDGVAKLGVPGAALGEPDTGWELGDDRIVAIAGGHGHGFLEPLDVGFLVEANGVVYRWEEPVRGSRWLEYGAVEATPVAHLLPDEPSVWRGALLSDGRLAISAHEHLARLSKDWSEADAYVEGTWDVLVTQIEAGDLNDDGIEDVVWSELDCDANSGASSARLLDGTLWGDIDKYDLPRIWRGHYAANGIFEHAVCGVVLPGDMNGDGVDDLIVQGQAAWLFYGPWTGDKTADDDADWMSWALSGGDAYSNLVALGDVDGDGYPELGHSEDGHGRVGAVEVGTPSDEDNALDVLSTFDCNEPEDSNHLSVHALGEAGGSSQRLMILTNNASHDDERLWFVAPTLEGARSCADDGLLVDAESTESLSGARAVAAWTDDQGNPSVVVGPETAAPATLFALDGDLMGLE